MDKKSLKLSFPFVYLGIFLLVASCGGEGASRNSQWNPGAGGGGTGEGGTGGGGTGGGGTGDTGTGDTGTGGTGTGDERPQGDLDWDNFDCTEPDENLQQVLNDDGQLALCPSGKYDIGGEPLQVPAGSKIYTVGARRISEYATLRSTDKNAEAIARLHKVKDVVIEHVNFDGRKYDIGSKTKVSGEDALLLVHASSNVTIRENVFKSTRTWSMAHFRQNEERGCTGNTFENNIILGAGVGPRGNGREEEEPQQDVKPHVGDGVSFHCDDSLVANNLILDATDGGVVVFGCPGSTVERNAIAVFSREALGGINVVDPADHERIPDGTPVEEYGNKSDGLVGSWDYRGLTVSENLIDAFGGRIHIGIAMGPDPWHPKHDGSTLVGATVIDNELEGDAFGYGFAVNGVRDWTVTGNTSTATHEGIAKSESESPEPGPFQVGHECASCELQSDFVEVGPDLRSLLRKRMAVRLADGNNYAPEYTDVEAEAIVLAAYYEMLGRAPTSEELNEEKNKLQKSTENSTFESRGDPLYGNTSDDIRLNLMESQEFQDANPDAVQGPVTRDSMQLFRLAKWFGLLDELVADAPETGNWPEARDMYRDAKNRIINGQ